MIDLDLFFRYLKGSCHGNQFCEKMAISHLSSLWHSETVQSPECDRQTHTHRNRTRGPSISCCFIKVHNHLPLNGCLLIGPIPWGHSGPLCHALSLSSLWTSMRRRRATVQWRHLVNWRETARCGEWAQRFSNASCFSSSSHITENWNSNLTIVLVSQLSN